MGEEEGGRGEGEDGGGERRERLMSCYVRCLCEVTTSVSCQYLNEVNLL